MRRERAFPGDRVRQMDPVLFGRTILPIGILLGVGTAGLVGGDVTAQVAVAATTAAASSFGLYWVLCGTVSRYGPQVDPSKGDERRPGRLGHGERLKADGSAKSE